MQSYRQFKGARRVQIDLKLRIITKEATAQPEIWARNPNPARELPETSDRHQPCVHAYHADHHADYAYRVFHTKYGP